MIGKTVSHYKIIEKLGEGGMGVVYKAEDTRLQRLVALKFLPEDLTKDASARERFIQEARAASTLDHPNICNIHDIDTTSEGQMFIVMAHYEGESLREKVNRGNVNIQEAVDIVLQVAKGLDKAHDNDIIHRDIKPANIIITREHQVKIVDFGLAKLVGQTKVTKTGTTLGTVGYMSPEQVTGGVVDHRSDIWSLGVVLYELISGRAPFEGDYDQAIAYAIVNEPHVPVSQLKPEVPHEFDELFKKALAKNPVDRFQDVAAFISKLRSIHLYTSPGSGASHSRNPGRKRRKRPLPVLTAVVIAVLAVSLIYFWWSKRSGDNTLPDEKPLEKPPIAKVPGAKRVTLTQATFSEDLEEYPAFSPDGAQIAYCREVNGYKHIFIKDLATGANRAITEGPRDNIQPAWSVDGTNIAYVRSNRTDGKLESSDKFGESVGGDIWKYSLESGKEMQLLEKAFNPSFSPDGEKIAFDSEWSKTRRIWVADRLGRNAQQITFDPSEAVAHIAPRWSPDGKKIVFQNMDWTKFDIKVVDLETKTMSWVTDDSFQDLNPVWMQSGNNILFSSYRTGGLNIWRIPVSNDGTPSGPPQPVTTGAGQDVQLAISPDGNRLAFAILKLNADLWRLPVSPKNGLLAGEPEQVIATTREDSRGAWSPDGSAIAFNSDRSGDMNIWIHSLEDSSTRQLTEGPGGDYQANWSPDGKTVAFFSARAGNPDIWVVDVDSGELKQLTRSASLDINPFFSPGGHYIAYQSDQYGRKEVWVMNADGTNQRQATNIGVSGHFMRWSPTQQYIFFRSPSITADGNIHQLSRVSLDGKDPMEFTSVMGSAHISLNPRYDMIMDVVGHRKLWVSYVVSHQYHEVFEFSDPNVRIDYPVWSPDGQWILFDYLKPGGGDIWIMEGFE